MRFGLFGAAFGLGFTFCPVSGGLLAKLSIDNMASHTAPGFFVSGLAFVNFVLAYQRLPESLTDEVKQMNASKSRKSQFTILLNALSIEGIAVLIIVFTMTTFVFSGLKPFFICF